MYRWSFNKKYENRVYRFLPISTDLILCKKFFNQEDGHFTTLDFSKTISTFEDFINWLEDS